MPLPRVLSARFLLLGAAVAVVLCGLSPVEALERTPDFTDHEIPRSQHPAPEDAGVGLRDSLVLFVALSLASLFALTVRSRAGLFVLTIASLIWFGFVREGCICPIGAIQNVALALGDTGYRLPAVAVVFFAMPLVFTLFFGRTFCAAVCPLGAVQELAAVRPVRVPAWLEHTLGLLAYVYLGLAVTLAVSGAAFVICRYDPFVAFFRLEGSRNMLILGAGFLLVGIFIGRPYCRFLCPYGAILGWLSKVSKWKVRIPPEQCIQCKLCEDACPYGAIQEPTVDQSSGERRQGRSRLAVLLVAAPVLVALGGLLGGLLEVPLSWMHPTVSLAEQVRLEDLGEAEETTDASDDFRTSGRKTEDLYAEAIALRDDFGMAGRWLGAWVGLAVAVKLIYLSLRRRRTDYQPDRTSCVACGRCFWYCPHEQAKRGTIADVVTLNKPS